MHAVQIGLCEILLRLSFADLSDINAANKGCKHVFYDKYGCNLQGSEEDKTVGLCVLTLRRV
jgi:hypothetical protein